jgi:electron transport complex protein RnfD
MNLLTVSGSPHLHGDQSLKKIMWGVVIALVPAMMVSFWYFGLAAIIITLTAVVSCLIFEYLIQKFLLKQAPTITDGSAIITGILLAFNVPSSLPVWQMVIGALVAIGIAKMSYGGLGKNPFNPALVGRVFLLISFPVDMTSWPLPKPIWSMVDAITGPTPLGVLKEGIGKGDTISQLAAQLPSYQDMFIGGIGGSLGEISAAALLLGGLFMMYKKIITCHIPVSYLLTVFVFTAIMWQINPEHYINPLFHLLAGGLMLGAIFMATDMVTSPMTYRGMLLYGFGCGVLTVLIRLWGSYPEGVSFAILIMNAVVPLINKGFKPKRFGEVIK